jgi:catechol 2,3-dioxygenase-like lactoylglutathione lyase family enzyme
MLITGVHHIQMIAPPGSEPDARAFYIGLLGLEEIPKPKSLQERGGVWFRTGGCDIHISVRENDTPPGTNRHVAFRVKNAEAMRQKLHKAGVKMDDATEVPGWKRFFAYDPFGNKLEFLEIL